VQGGTGFSLCADILSIHEVLFALIVYFSVRVCAGRRG
jgi:hypothetical protein